MKNYSLFKLGAYTCVLRTHDRATMSDANFLRTGKSLCGVLLPKETLKQWKLRKELARLDHKKLVAKFWKNKYYGGKI